MDLIKQYIQVIKPGIIFGNLISVIGGFLLAAKGVINYQLLLMTILGVSLVIASACGFNNYIDLDIDQIMERTKNRPLVTRLIKPKFCFSYATILGITGIALLYITTNYLASLLAIIGFTIYIGIYSLYMKRKSIYSTIIGSLSGAMPPVIGYCAVSNQFDMGALILLCIFSLWQIPHSYAIAIFYFKDYQTAKIPVLPVIKGISVTKTHIFLYMFVFIIATIMLAISGYVGYKYLVITTIVSLWWLHIAISGFRNQNNDHLWARKLFLFSIVVINSLSIMMSLDPIVISK